MSLPDKASPDIHLVIGTAAENDAQQHVNSAEWRGALSVEAYLRREKHLSDQDFTRDGGLTAWLLVHQPDPNGPRKVLCGCETFYKRALVGRNGQVEDVIAYGIGSVFTPSEHRGKGYGGRMLTMLGERLKSWEWTQGRTCLFSVLYSDIGKDYYAARGWRPFPSTHVALPPTSTSSRPHGVRMLKSEDLPDLCARDEELIRARLSRGGTEKKTAVALLPDLATLRWHHARDEFVGQELRGKSPTFKGAIVGNTPGSRVWCIWQRVWAHADTDSKSHDSPNILHILRLVIEDAKFSDFGPASPNHAADPDTARAVAKLFTTAQAEAAEWGMDEVEIWNPTSTTVAAAQMIDPKTAVVQREDESITSLRWYGSGDGQDVEWICNEKYGWC